MTRQEQASFSILPVRGADDIVATVNLLRVYASSLDIDVYAYVRAESYAEFLGVQEELLLRILDIVEHAGTSVAFPTQTVYVRPDGAPAAPTAKDRSSA